MSHNRPSHSLPTGVKPEHLHSNGLILSDAVIQRLEKALQGRIENMRYSKDFILNLLCEQYGVTRRELKQKLSPAEHLLFERGGICRNYNEATGRYELFAIYKDLDHNQRKALKVGEGSFGKVKIVQNLSTKEWLADKIAIEISTDKQRKEFYAEAKKQKALGYPEGIILPKIDKNGNVDNSKLSMLVKYVPGTPVEDVLKNPNLPLEDRYAIVLQAFEAVSKMHSERKSLHRDIKPANMHWDPASRKLGLVDAGLAVKLNNRGQYHDGDVNGTPFYLPPSILSSGVYSADTDVYALGRIMQNAFGIHAKYEPAGANGMKYNTADICRPEGFASHQLFQMFPIEDREALKKLANNIVRNRTPLSAAISELAELRNNFMKKIEKPRAPQRPSLENQENKKINADDVIAPTVKMVRVKDKPNRVMELLATTIKNIKIGQPLIDINKLAEAVLVELGDKLGSHPTILKNDSNLEKMNQLLALQGDEALNKVNKRNIKRFFEGIHTFEASAFIKPANGQRFNQIFEFIRECTTLETFTWKSNLLDYDKAESLAEAINQSPSQIKSITIDTDFESLTDIVHFIETLNPNSDQKVALKCGIDIYNLLENSINLKLEKPLNDTAQTLLALCKRYPNISFDASAKNNLNQAAEVATLPSDLKALENNALNGAVSSFKELQQLDRFLNFQTYDFIGRKTKDKFQEYLNSIKKLSLENLDFKDASPSQYAQLIAQIVEKHSGLKAVWISPGNFPAEDRAIIAEATTQKKRMLVENQNAKAQFDILKNSFASIMAPKPPQPAKEDIGKKADDFARTQQRSQPLASIVDDDDIEEIKMAEPPKTDYSKLSVEVPKEDEATIEIIPPIVVQQPIAPPNQAAELSEIPGGPNISDDNQEFEFFDDALEEEPQNLDIEFPEDVARSVPEDKAINDEEFEFFIDNVDEQSRNVDIEFSEDDVSSEDEYSQDPNAWRNPEAEQESEQAAQQDYHEDLQINADIEETLNTAFKEISAKCADLNKAYYQLQSRKPLESVQLNTLQTYVGMLSKSVINAIEKIQSAIPNNEPLYAELENLYAQIHENIDLAKNSPSHVNIIMATPIRDIRESINQYMGSLAHEHDQQHDIGHHAESHREYSSSRSESASANEYGDSDSTELLEKIKQLCQSSEERYEKIWADISEAGRVHAETVIAIKYTGSSDIALADHIKNISPTIDLERLQNTAERLAKLSENPQENIDAIKQAIEFQTTNLRAITNMLENLDASQDNENSLHHASTSYSASATSASQSEASFIESTTPINSLSRHEMEELDRYDAELLSQQYEAPDDSDLDSVMSDESDEDMSVSRNSEFSRSDVSRSEASRSEASRSEASRSEVSRSLPPSISSSRHSLFSSSQSRSQANAVVAIPKTAKDFPLQEKLPGDFQLGESLLKELEQGKYTNSFTTDEEDVTDEEIFACVKIPGNNFYIVYKPTDLLDWYKASNAASPGNKTFRDPLGGTDVDITTVMAVKGEQLKKFAKNPTANAQAENSTPPGGPSIR